MGLNPSRGSLLNHRLPQLVVGNVIRYNDDPVRVNRLGPRRCHLAVKEPGVNPGQPNLNVAITKDGAFRDGTSGLVVLLRLSSVSSAGWH